MKERTRELKYASSQEMVASAGVLRRGFCQLVLLSSAFLITS